MMEDSVILMKQVYTFWLITLCCLIMVDTSESVESIVSSISSISSDITMDRGRVRSVGNISRVVGMSGGDSIGIGKSIVDLGNGVGISISLGLSLSVSLPLANVVSIEGAIGTVGVESIVGSQMTSITEMSRSQTMTIIYTSDNSGLTIVSCLQGRDASPNLGNGVGISVSISRHSSNGNTSKYKSLHCYSGQSRKTPH